MTQAGEERKGPISYCRECLARRSAEAVKRQRERRRLAGKLSTGHEPDRRPCAICGRTDQRMWRDKGPLVDGEPAPLCRKCLLRGRKWEWSLEAVRADWIGLRRHLFDTLPEIERYSTILTDEEPESFFRRMLGHNHHRCIADEIVVRSFLEFLLMVRRVEGEIRLG